MKKKIIIAVSILVVICGIITAVVLIKKNGNDKDKAVTSSNSDISVTTQAPIGSTAVEVQATTQNATKNDKTTTSSFTKAGETKKVVKKKVTTTKASTDPLDVLVKKNYWFELVIDDEAVYRYKFLDNNFLHRDYYAYVGGGESVEKDFEYVESESYKYSVVDKNTIKATIDDITYTWKFNRKTGELSYTYYDGFTGKDYDKEVYRHKDITDFVTSRWDEYFELIKKFG